MELDGALCLGFGRGSEMVQEVPLPLRSLSGL